MRVLTTCVYCGCGCNYYLNVEDGKVIGVTPSGNDPISRGSLCIKGWNVYEFIHSPDRLKKPLIKENGKFREASWEEALNVVAKNLKEIKDNHGSDSLAFLSSAKTTNEANYVMQKFARAVMKTNNVDNCARLCHSPTVAGLAAVFGSGAMTNSIDEIENAKTILIVGSNTTEQHPLIGARIIKAVEKGAKLIVTDPRTTELSKFSTISMHLRPGTDVAVLNGLMNVILKEGLEDKEYIKERCENFDELKNTVVKYTPDYVSSITGIDAEDIVKAARIFAKNRPASVVYSMGITQHTTGTDNVKSCANLSMITGNVGVESGGVNALRGQQNVQGACDIGALPNVYSGYQKVTDAAARKKMEKAWNVTDLPDTVGLTVVEIMNAADNGDIKGLYVMGENPMMSNPDGNHVKKGLEKLDFMVVQDIFMTETAKLADVVLPAASFAEVDGTFTSTERRVQRVRRAIEPLGEARIDWEIIQDIASRLDYDMGFNCAKDVMDEIASVTPIYGGMFYDRLEPHGLRWPCSDRNHPGTKYLHKDKFSRGLGLLTGTEFRDPAELPDEEYDFTLSTGRTLEHFQTGTMTRRSTTLDREVPTSFIEVNPEDAKKMNIHDGQKVKVSTRRGSAEPVAKVTEKVKPKMLFMTFHFKGVAANVLTNPALDPISKIPEYKVCAAKLELC